MALDNDFFIKLAYALGIGVLVGLERAMDHAGSEAEPNADKPVVDLGVRTFSVLSLLGLSAALAAELVPWLTAVVLAGVGFLIVAMYRRSPTEDAGITTELAAFATCVLGVLCAFQPKAAGVLALVLTVLLAAKRFSWSVVRKMRRVELTATLKFLVIVLIVLPLLPDSELDPYGAFNPFKVGVLVVLISGISFVGYFLTRILGERRGLGLTGVLGGLTSSTAVTAAMAAQAREQPRLRLICAFSTIVANATMFVRVPVVVGIISLDLMLRVVWSLGTMAAAAAVASAVLWMLAGRSRSEAAERDDGPERAEVELENPFSIGPALKFASFFVVILFAARLGQRFFGDAGLFLASALSGLADVDAITLSIAEQGRSGTLELDVGALGITIAVVSNSVVKTAIALYSGGMRFGALVGLCLVAATGLGLGVAFVI